MHRVQEAEFVIGAEKEEFGCHRGPSYHQLETSHTPHALFRNHSRYVSRSSQCTELWAQAYTCTLVDIRRGVRPSDPETHMHIRESRRSLAI